MIDSQLKVWEEDFEYRLLVVIDKTIAPFIAEPGTKQSTSEDIRRSLLESHVVPLWEALQAHRERKRFWGKFPAERSRDYDRVEHQLTLLRAVYGDKKS